MNGEGGCPPWNCAGAADRGPGAPGFGSRPVQLPAPGPAGWTPLRCARGRREERCREDGDPLQAGPGPPHASRLRRSGALGLPTPRPCPATPRPRRGPTGPRRPRPPRPPPTNRRGTSAGRLADSPGPAPEYMVMVPRAAAEDRPRAPRAPTPRAARSCRPHDPPRHGCLAEQVYPTRPGRRAEAAGAEGGGEREEGGEEEGREGRRRRGRPGGGGKEKEGGRWQRGRGQGRRLEAARARGAAGWVGGGRAVAAPRVVAPSAGPQRRPRAHRPRPFQQPSAATSGFRARLAQHCDPVGVLPRRAPRARAASRRAPAPAPRPGSLSY